MQTIQESQQFRVGGAIVAVEDDEEEEDFIPGPAVRTSSVGSNSLNGSGRSQSSTSRSRRLRVFGKARVEDELQISTTEHRWAGQGILASLQDLELAPETFAAGCNLLQGAARGDIGYMRSLLRDKKTHVDFRDYDRRTALHVAASEGHLGAVKFLVEESHAKVNRSDRWGGSPLDDAHRHRHAKVVEYLRQHGAVTGSGNRLTNLIQAAADGDQDEVRTLLKIQAKLASQNSQQSLDINKGDYDRRTALHLAAGEGHKEIVDMLCQAGADVNVEDRWKRRPLDDAIAGEFVEIVKLLESHGAQPGPVPAPAALSSPPPADLDQSTKRALENMHIEFEELEMIDRIGSGAFGEIYKCRWRGTLVATKIIKSAKIRRDWMNRRITNAIRSGAQDVDEAIRELDKAEYEQADSKEKDMALADFRREISVLKSLRHPHIVLLLAYSTTEDYECLISELMKCSLLDVFRSHHVQGTKMPHRTQILYGMQLARGMNYIHSIKVIHRDLKPANLLIDNAGVLKISDFGLSKIRPDPGQHEVDVFKMTGETGSYRFMAPEVFRHQPYNETVDIYSYSMILFYLLVGRPPWPHLPGLDAVQRASEDGDRPNIPRDLDERLQLLLKECWDENANLRPSFKSINQKLMAYSKDVLQQDDNELENMGGGGADRGCNCVIQ